MKTNKADMTEKLIINPIGILHSELVYRYETPRQGILAEDTGAEIWLEPHRNFEQAVKDLEGFERLWIIYWFHKSQNWKPLVKPPRQIGKKVGVFSSRSPFRPNPVGLSCVKLIRTEGLKLFISGSDILDGSPVIDIKPYLPYSDSFPDSATGWVETDLRNIFEVTFSQESLKYAENLKKEQDVNLKSYAKIQLQFDPADTSRKRINSMENELFCLDYQKWQILYRIDTIKRKVLVTEIRTK